MKQFVHAFFFFCVLMALTMLPERTTAQKTTSFNNEIYREAIQNIAVKSQGRLSRDAIISQLEWQDRGVEPPVDSPSGIRADSIYLVPEIRLIGYNSPVANFGYFPRNTFYEDSVLVSFPENPNWLTGLVVVDSASSSINIGVQPNPSSQPRSTEVLVKGIQNGDTVAFSGFILQQPAPQKFIFVSPKYLAAPPEGGQTETVNVTTFNIDEWTASFTENWISVDSASLTNTQIVFGIAENTGETPRQATIQIHDIQNQSISDELTIFQYADTSAYIIATPSGGYLNSGPGDFAVVVNANIPWEVVYDDVPSGMIADSTISASGVIFQVTANTSQSQRTAQTSLRGTANPGVSAQVQITQAAESPPYIFVTPENNYIGPEASDITLNVDANLDWVTDIFHDPYDMISVGVSTPNSVTLNVSANDLPVTRIAEGRIIAQGSPLPADTFRIIQDPVFILLDPAQKLLPCEGETFMVHITSNSNDSIIIDESGFSGNIVRFGNDSLRLIFPPNQGQSAIIDTLPVCSFSTPAVCAQLIIYQYACNESYVIVTPHFRSVGFEGGTNEPYEITAANIPDWEVTFNNPLDWISDTQINGNELQFVLDPNTGSATRQATFRVQSTTNPGIFDSAIIFQNGAPAPLLLAAPREQIVSHLGNDSVNFEITAQNISGWEVDMNSLANWITIDSAGGSLLSLDVQPNTGPDTRLDALRIFATDNPAISDTVFIFQYSGNNAYILASPRSDTVLFTGDQNLEFDITGVNVGKPGIAPLPEWISEFSLSDSNLIVTIDTNFTSGTRLHFISLFDSLNPAIRDSVAVYQYAAPEKYILASPRADTVMAFGDDDLRFDILAVNIPDWQVDTENLMPWIHVNTPHQPDYVSLTIDTNLTTFTRFDTIWIESTDQPEIRDFVVVYQYAKNESYLLAAPREQKVGHTGNPLLAYFITKSNVDIWEVDENTVPGWISVEQSGDFLLGLNVTENSTLATRTATVRIFDSEQPDVEDSVKIFQYSGLDHYLIAAPREKKFSRFSAASSQFSIDRANILNWEVDAEMVPGWIQINASGDNTLDIDVLENNSFSSRQTELIIFSADLPDVRDTVNIYQYAASDTLILASPREAVIGSQGNTDLQFSITTQNADAWKVDPASLESWTHINSQGGNLLSIRVDTNLMVQSKTANLIVYDTINPAARDSVFIYQYSPPRSSILAAPREQVVSHEGASVNYFITSVNLPGGWEVDTNTVQQQWISITNSGGAFLTLDVDANTSLESRADTIRLVASGMPEVTDSVMVYQYSGFDHYLLAAPRELKTGYQANTLNFVISSANVESWQAEIIGNPGWIETVIAGGDTLGLALNQNDSSQTRIANIRIFSDEYPEASDTVSVYQYSTFSPFIVIDPTFEYFPSNGDSLLIYSFSNVDDYIVEKEPGKTWFSLSDSTLSHNDSVWLHVEPNPFAYLGRSSYLVFRTADSSIVNYFYFQQRKNSLNFITISGSVFLEGDIARPLDSTVMIIGTDSVFTGTTEPGFTYQAPYGWVGAITPQKTGYFFEPPSFVFETQQTDSIHRVFDAFKIDPKIRFNIEGDTIPICDGDQIDTTHPDYPVIGVSGTFGSRQYRWYSVPPDPNLNTDTTSSPAIVVFAPEVTTTYYLELFNYNTSDETHFTVQVNPLPSALQIEGPAQVCRNQSGTVYYAGNYSPGDGFSFSWDLSGDGDVDFLSGKNSNIAVIDWGDTPGEYELTLTTYNTLGCSDFTTKNITVNDATAPPGTIVEKKAGTNMLVCLDTLVDSYEWGWDTLINGQLGGRYVIPDRNNWYCRLPEGHTFDPDVYRYFVITYYNDHECGSLTYFNPPVGIDENVDDEIRIYPNPTTGLIYLQLPRQTDDSGGRCSILNVSGLTMLTTYLDGHRAGQIITLNHAGKLQPGLYFLKLEIGKQVYNQKVIVR